jgi:hypothetical protein
VWLDSEFEAESSVYDGKKFVSINVPGAESSSASAINNNNDVILAWEDENDGYHGALLHKGKFYNFDDPKGDRTWGYGLNDHRVIAGSFRPTGKQVHAGFVGTY